MPAFRSNNLRGFLLLLLWLLPLPIVADDSGVDVTRAEIEASKQGYLLHADLVFRLSRSATEALASGVALVWAVRLRICESSCFFWQSTVLDITQYYKVSYHALMNIYQIEDENTGQSDSFSNLQSALGKLGKIRGLKIADDLDFLEHRQYSAGLKVTLEKEQLPLPLRPVSYLNSDWYLSSDWYRWSLQE